MVRSYPLMFRFPIQAVLCLTLRFKGESVVEKRGKSSVSVFADATESLITGYMNGDMASNHYLENVHRNNR